MPFFGASPPEKGRTIGGTNMKKRLICLLLGLVMLFSLALTACSRGDDIDEAEDKINREASKAAKTLTMWVVSENKLSDETINLVTEELNAITKSKFKTQLIVKFLTRDVYEKTLSDEITAYEDARKQNGVIQTEAQTTAGEAAETDATETLASGIVVIKYPEVVPHQVDIVYIAGEDMYLDFVEKGWLLQLDEHLNGTSKKIKEYISSTLLSAAKLNGATYAVPNNNVIGEYTYMLLNKDLMEKYSQQGYATLGMIDGFFNTYLYNFLKQIHLFEKDVIPVNATYEDCLQLLGHYWNVDPADYSVLKKFSVFGQHYTDIESLSRGSVILGYNSLFENEEFTADYLKLNEFKFDGYFDDSKDKEAAVKFVKGDSTVLETYKDDYYAVVVEYPTASTDDIYSNMFGVCRYTRDDDRAMQIVTYLNTNPEFRNLLQYGVEHVHYRFVTNEEGTKTELVRMNEDYMMDIYATGNAFLAYPEPDMSPDIWENGKVQNRASLVNPLLGFNIADFAVSSVKKTEEFKLPEMGYEFTYSTGYSKDVLTQNTLINSWINSCDAKAEKGVYVLKTSQLSGQNLTCNYYVYNNNVGNGQTFSVVADPVINTEVDADGKEKKTLVNVDFVLSYADGKSNTEGYELSLFTLKTKKSVDYALKSEVNGAEVAIAETDAKQFIAFDFFDTKEYDIDVYENLSKTAVLKNQAMMDWIEECDNQAYSKGKQKKTLIFVKEYVNPDTKEETYVVYLTGIKYTTTLDIQVTGGEGEVDIAFNFNYTEDKFYEIDTAKDQGYMLYYVRVKPKAEKLDVSCTVLANGSKTIVERQTAKEDPDFLMLGNLDTELVKFTYELNRQIVEILDACKNIDELKAVVAELKVLLSTDAKAKLKIDDFTVLKDWINTGIIGGDLETLHEYVVYAAANEPVKKIDGTQTESLWEDPVTGVTEAYVYYDSLCALYYKWMDAYGFKPAEEKE